MALFHKIYRSISDLKETFLSKCRIWNLRFKYPSLKMDSKCLVAKNCVVVCVDGADFNISNTYLGPGTFIVVEKGATLKISDSYIGPQCVIVAKEYIEIKSHCSIAEMVVIRDQEHEYGKGKLIRDSKDITGKIILEENVWIGAKATILKNVRIGQNSVVGAHSLVNSDFPENSVVAGIPARLIK